MPIKVWNHTKHPVHLKSFDGNSVTIAANARGVQVANKFNWQVPEGMRVIELGEEKIDPTTVVKGRTVVPARRPPRAHNKAGVPSNSRMDSLLKQSIERRKLIKAEKERKINEAKEAYAAQVAVLNNRRNDPKTPLTTFKVDAVGDVSGNALTAAIYKDAPKTEAPIESPKE